MTSQYSNYHLTSEYIDCLGAAAPHFHYSPTKCRAGSPRSELMQEKNSHLVMRCLHKVFSSPPRTMTLSVGRRMHIRGPQQNTPGTDDLASSVRTLRISSTTTITHRSSCFGKGLSNHFQTPQSHPGRPSTHHPLKECGQIEAQIS